MGSESDDIDAGWDEVPASGTPHVAVAAAPSSVPAPAPADAPFEVLPLVTRRAESSRSSESLSPAEVLAPRPSAEPSALSRFGPLGALVVLAAATVLWFGHAPKADAPPAVGAARPLAPLAAPVVEKPVSAANPATGPSPLPVVPSPAPAAADRLELEPLVLEAPGRSTVSVRSVPEGAAFFEAGQRLGTGEVRIHLAPQSKRHLTALLNGYQPLNFKVDGTSPTVTVRLTPATSAPVAAAAPATPATAGTTP